MQVLGDMAAGNNPNRGKAPEERFTVARAFARFFEAKPDLAASSVSGYSRTCDLYLKPWRKYELVKLTRDMILQRHRQISTAHGKTTAYNVMRHLRSVYNLRRCPGRPAVDLGVDHGFMPKTPVLKPVVFKS